MRKVPGFDVYIDDDGVCYRYERSKVGVPRNHKALITERLIQVSVRTDKDGYFIIYCETDDGYKTQLHVHRAKALAFIPNPENLPQVDHINRIKTDNRIENLRWATVKDQALNRDKTIEAFERNGVREREDRKLYDRVKYHQKTEEGYRYRLRPNGKRGWVFVGV